MKAVNPNPADVLTYALTTAPAGMILDATTGLLQWTPTAAQLGAHTITVTVQDAGGLTASQSFTLTVMPPNHPPVIGSTPVTDAEARQTYRYDVNATIPTAAMS